MMTVDFFRKFGSKKYKNLSIFGTIRVQRRFDIQLAGAIKIQLKRGKFKTRFGVS